MGLYFNKVKNDHEKIRIFCFPYGGGGPSVFLSWEGKFDPSITLYPAHYPGHEDRILEKPISNMNELVKQIYNEICIRKLNDKPFVLFGHSLGSRIIYELALLFEDARDENLLGIIAASQHSPNRNENCQIYKLPTQDFITELSKYNRTPIQVFQNKDLWNLIEPALRADFHMADIYCDYRHRKLHIPLLFIYGSKEHFIRDEDLKDWADYTTGKFYCSNIPEGHFYIETQPDEVIGKIKEFIILEGIDKI